MKIIIAAVIILALVLPVQAGSKKYNSKGQAKPERATVMSNQAYANWLSAGCPPLVQPQPQPQKGVPHNGNGTKASQQERSR
jgi:hypothetical protein